tara:strand:- start:418 stop:2532 length:2115 start_codon:yes stop_codon:yes gene_type:complete
MNLENADYDETPVNSEDDQDLLANRTFDIPDIKFENGTNIPEGTKYIYQISKTTTWYTPRESVAPANWQQQWDRLKNRFEKIIFQCRPIECTLLQTRVPGYTRDSHPVTSKIDYDRIKYSSTGMSRDFSFLSSPDGIPLFSDYQISDAKGKPICNTANDAYGVRFGLHRQYFFFSGPNWVNERREFPGPELHELEKECSRLLYQLPSHVAELLWKNWPEGFDRRQNSNEGLWFDAMFELAWQGQPADRLYAERHAPTKNGSVGLKGPGLFPTIPKDLEEFVKDINHEHGYPIWTISHIDDIVRTSIAAIDELLLSDSQIKPFASQVEIIPESEKIMDSHWYSLNGFTDQKKHINWELISDQAQLLSLPHGDGLRIQIHLLDRPESAWIAFAKTKEILTANKVTWIKTDNPEWTIDLDKLLELYSDVLNLDWLCGSISTTPHFIPEPIGITTYNRPFRSTVVLYITSDLKSTTQIDSAEIEWPDNDIILENRNNSGLYGIIWKGNQISLNRSVAVKIIKPEMENRESAIRHALKLARLQHRNIVTVYKIAKVKLPKSAQIVDAVIMEWLEGQTLKERLSKEKLTLTEVKYILDSIFNGLSYMHSRNLIHGDIHEANIIITEFEVKIIDPLSTSSITISSHSSSLTENHTQRDVELLRPVIRHILYQSVIDDHKIRINEPRLNMANTLSDFQTLLSEILSSDSSEI